MPDGDGRPAGAAGPEVPVGEVARPRAGIRAILGAALTTASVLLVWVALAAPDRPARLVAPAYLRLPLEGILLLAVLLLLPPRGRRAVAVMTGVVLAALVVVRLLDLGLYAVTGHPFDLVTDWGYVGSARGLLADAVGSGWSWAIAAGAVLLVVGLLVLFPLAVVRVARAVATRPEPWRVATAALVVAWLVAAVAGPTVGTGDPVAATSAAGLVVGHVEQVEADRADRAAFARQAAVDPYQATPGADLLTALRGKDVLLVFVESYGRVALDGPATVTTPVSAALTRAQAALSRGGWSSRSALLTSSTYGGLSWLAHSTLQSGLWVDDQQRYDDLVAGDRLTLSSAFRRAGWRTASVVPSDHGPWWVGSRFYRFDAMSDADDLGYTGPSFGYADVPDEFTLARLAQRELAPGHRPVMAEVDLVSSHGPWTPLPSLVPWAEATDSSVYAGMPAGQPSAAQIWPTPARVQASYGRSIAYSLDSLVAFVENAHDDNLVLVVLGDHQPASIVSGPHSDRDVPISIISHDPSVLDRIDGWGWQDGLRPTPEAPRWRMDQFRDRFLAAYR